MDYEITFLDPRDHYLLRTAIPEILDNDEAKAAMRVLKHVPGANLMDFQIEARNTGGTGDEPSEKPSDARD